MRAVFRRIALHGGLTALLLGVVGFMFAELAAIWLAASPGTRAATGEPLPDTDADGTVTATLRARVPLLMAVWGFAFVAVGELVMYWWRGDPTPSAKPLAREPDPAEKLLEEILSQVEADTQRSREPG